MNQNLLATAFFFGLMITILYVALLILSPFLEALTWAAILAIIVYPAYAWLNRALRGRATAAALIVTILITLVILIPAFKLAGFLSDETVQLVSTVRAFAHGGGLEAWKQEPWVESLLGYWQSITDQVGTLGIDLKNAAVQAAQVASGFLVPRLSGIAQNVFLFAINTLIVLFSLFFFLRDGKELCAKIGRVLPMDQEKQKHLFSNIVNSIIAVVHGCVITAMIQGLLAGLGYWAFGVPFAVLWGVVTFFGALFPIGGSALIWVPASVYLFLAGDYLRGFLLIGWGVGVVSMVDNFLKPIFIGNRLRVPILFLFFSIIGGMNLFGVLGLVLGPVLFALLAALLDLYMQEYGKPQLS